MPIAKFDQVVLDCPDPAALAAFYAGLLGGTPEVQEDWVSLRIPGGPGLAFQAAPEQYPRSGRRATARSSSIWT